MAAPWNTPSSRRTRTLALLLGALAVNAGPSATSALAVRGHVFGHAFASKGAAPGQLTEPGSVAVNEATGNVYVYDRGNNRVEYFSASGAYLGRFDGSGTFFEIVEGKEVEKKGTAAGGGGQLNEVPTGQLASAGQNQASIAVDNACAVHKLSETTSPTCKEFDPSSGDVYVVDGFAHKVIDKFAANGGYVGQITAKTAETNPELFTSWGVAVDSNGNVLMSSTQELVNGIDRLSNGESNAFMPPFQQLSVSGNPVVAADSLGDLYFSEESGTFVVEFNSSGTILNARLDAEHGNIPPDGIATELTTNDVYVDNVESIARFSPSGSEIERFGEGSLPPDCGERVCEGGVAVNSASGQVFVVDGSTGVVEEYPLQPPSSPEVKNESAAEVADDSATLAAELDPRSLPTESPTQYSFQYGACASPTACSTSGYGASTPLVSLSPSFEVERVSVHVSSLRAGTTYHYRVVAENEISKKEGRPVVGSEQTFTTRGTGEFVLPDGRQWEMVSPPQKQGALIERLGLEAVVQAAAGGDAISYVTASPTESEPRGLTNLSQVFSARGPVGWQSVDINLPHPFATGLSVGQGQEYRSFSPDLSLGVVQPFGEFDASISSEASEQTAFLHSDFSSGASGEPCRNLCFHPLATSANVTSGNRFGEEGACGANQQFVHFCGPEFRGATADLGHVILQSNVALTGTPAPAGSLYEWSAGRPPSEQLQLISLLPPSGGEELPAIGPRLGLSKGQGFDARHAISQDGSRVFWSSQESAHLYLRDTVHHTTLQIDTPEPGCPPPEHECGEGAVDAEFEGASADGSRVFFTDTQKLTKDGHVYPQAESSEGADLYEYDLEKPVAERLTDVAPAGAVLGRVLGSSEDGSWVYFVGNAALVPSAVHGSCLLRGHGQPLSNQACNLYVYRAGQTKLVAVLSGADVPDWAGALTQLTARVSPGGEWLAFQSQRSLTGYDTRDAVSGKPDEEVYLYDAGAGRLACASCDPTGARPRGVEYQKIVLAGGGKGVWPDSAWVAGTIPGWTPYTGGGDAIYQSRYLSDSGRLFFNAHDALVPKDVNNAEDVYQYEPEHVGTCSSSASSGGVVFKPEANVEVEGHEVTEGPGCVGLISSGSSPDESAFLDASETGGDVFFLTTERLAPQDFDNALDVYDAHECTMASPCLPPPATRPPACTTEASCKPAPSPQPGIFGLSGSATFSGPGNLAPPPPAKPKTAAQARAERLAKALKLCRKDRSRRKRAACERQARKRYAALRATRARNGRRGR
jgi:DNA-binding beta-propeller fold protein YncE